MDLTSLLFARLIYWMVSMPAIGLIVLTAVLIVVQQIKPIKIKTDRWF